MTNAEAKKLLQYHSFTDDNIHHPKMTNGFLGMLRPFKGVLIESNYHEVMAVIRCLADEWRDDTRVDREVVSALWSICHLTRSWAIDPEGMLRRNGLIQSEQIDTLQQWIDTISYATMITLAGGDDDTAFGYYDDEQSSR